MLFKKNFLRGAKGTLFPFYWYNTKAQYIILPLFWWSVFICLTPLMFLFLCVVFFCFLMCVDTVLDVLLNRKSMELGSVELIKKSIIYKLPEVALIAILYFKV